jgi:hypothetical protein
MATLAKFKYYSDLFIQYVTSRFGILKFIGFALLLVMLGADKISEWELYVKNFIFVFASLFVFRMVDDVWSFHRDRKNRPKRKYIQPENIKGFIVLTGIIFFIYQVTLFFYSPFLGYIILILFLVSTFLYLLFYKTKSEMVIIPLLKYPVFIWCISQFSMLPDILFLSFGAFLMMAVFDFMDENPTKTKRLFTKIALLLITGLFVLHPWNGNGNMLIQIILMLAPFILFILPKSKLYKFFPVLIFPIIHVIDLII